MELPGIKVTGRVGAETEKPVPVMVAELMVTAAAPVEVTVTVCVVDVPTDTLPKARLAELTVNAGSAISTSTLVLAETPPSLAVRTTVWGLVTVEAVATKPAPVAPAAMLTDAGTETAELLLERFTVIPPLGAAVLRVTAQESVPDSGIVPMLHVRELIAGASINPIPLRPTTGSESVPTLLVMDSWPEAAPDSEGLKATLNV
jgi:hypothetical protein